MGAHMDGGGARFRCTLDSRCVAVSLPASLSNWPAGGGGGCVGGFPPSRWTTSVSGEVCLPTSNIEKQRGVHLAARPIQNSLFRTTAVSSPPPGKREACRMEACAGPAAPSNPYPAPQPYGPPVSSPPRPPSAVGGGGGGSGTHGTAVLLWLLWPAVAGSRGSHGSMITKDPKPLVLLGSKGTFPPSLLRSAPQALQGNPPPHLLCGPT